MAHQRGIQSVEGIADIELGGREHRNQRDRMKETRVERTDHGLSLSDSQSRRLHQTPAQHRRTFYL